MKGTEFRNAIRQIDNVESLKYFRPETVHRAVGQVLSYVGARRLHLAQGREPEAAADRRLTQILAEVEDAAVRLDAIPQRSEYAHAREAVWNEVLDKLGLVKMLLESERAAITMAERLSKRDTQVA